MIGTVIHRQFIIEKDFPEAAALSVILMALILVGVLTYARLLGTEELMCPPPPGGGAGPWGGWRRTGPGWPAGWWWPTCSSRWS
jgi:ABC-type Fe3+ transport system permease subunit